jgi:hypothetical protein
MRLDNYLKDRTDDKNKDWDLIKYTITTAATEILRLQNKAKPKILRKHLKKLSEVRKNLLQDRQAEKIKKTIMNIKEDGLQYEYSLETVY